MPHRGIPHRTLFPSFQPPPPPFPPPQQPRPPLEEDPFFRKLGDVGGQFGQAFSQIGDFFRQQFQQEISKRPPFMRPSPGGQLFLEAAPGGRRPGFSSITPDFPDPRGSFLQQRGIQQAGEATQKQQMSSQIRFYLQGGTADPFGQYAEMVANPLLFSTDELDNAAIQLQDAWMRTRGLGAQQPLSGRRGPAVGPSGRELPPSPRDIVPPFARAPEIPGAVDLARRGISASGVGQRYAGRISEQTRQQGLFQKEVLGELAAINPDLVKRLTEKKGFWETPGFTWPAQQAPWTPELSKIQWLGQQPEFQIAQREVETQRFVDFPELYPEYLRYQQGTLSPKGFRKWIATTPAALAFLRLKEGRETTARETATTVAERRRRAGRLAPIRQRA